jgi:maleate cis-trans isomerase
MVEDMERQAKLLATADVDVIVLGATAPSFLNGLGYDRELIGKIETATGRKATTTSTALVEAIRHFGGDAHRVGKRLHGARERHRESVSRSERL